MSSEENCFMCEGKCINNPIKLRNNIKCANSVVHFQPQTDTLHRSVTALHNGIISVQWHLPTSVMYGAESEKSFPVIDVLNVGKMDKCEFLSNFDKS